MLLKYVELKIIVDGDVVSVDTMHPKDTGC